MGERSVYLNNTLCQKSCRVDDGDSRCCSAACPNIRKGWLPRDAFCEQYPDSKLVSEADGVFFRRPGCRIMFGG